MSATLRTIGALVRRALNEIARVPGASLPGILAPTIFMLGLSSVFGRADRLPGFTADDFRTYILPVGFLQGAAFTGAATGVNLARDIERGWFDRMLLAPAPRLTLLAGIVGSASLRALLPATFLFVVGMSLGVQFPGVDGLFIGIALVMGLAAVMAFWGVIVALRFKTQQAAPLMQVAGFVAVLFTTAYAPKALLTGWLETIATINPVTPILEGVRQGFVGGVNGHDTLLAFWAVLALLAVFGALATRGMQRFSD
jgi:ABC-2 type transport system permease protein